MYSYKQKKVFFFLFFLSSNEKRQCNGLFYRNADWKCLLRRARAGFFPSIHNHKRDYPNICRRYWQVANAITYELYISFLKSSTSVSFGEQYAERALDLFDLRKLDAVAAAAQFRPISELFISEKHTQIINNYLGNYKVCQFKRRAGKTDRATHTAKW